MAELYKAGRVYLKKFREQVTCIVFQRLQLKNIEIFLVILQSLCIY